MRRYIISILVISLIGVFGGVCFIQAGFGISPPFINNDRLTPGSHLEKTIYLVRGTPTTELMAEVTIDAPGIEGWITIEKGLRFPLPKGVQQFPMKVIIDVPSDAAYGSYQGYIRVRVIPSGGGEGQVTTLLGARIDISLAVTEKGFSDFKVRGISIPNVEKESPLVVLINLENTGNTKIRPSKVHLDIYDLNHIKILESGDITETGWAGAFETKQVEGELPIELDLGEYWADVTVYKEGESLGISKIYFKVVPEIEKPGVLAGEEAKSFLFLYLPYIGIGIVLLIILLILTWASRKKMRVVFKEEGQKRIKKRRNLKPN